MAISQDLREKPPKQFVPLSIFSFHLPETVVHIPWGYPLIIQEAEERESLGTRLLIIKRLATFRDVLYNVK